MKKMRTFLVALLALVLLTAPMGPAVRAEEIDYDSLYYYPAENLNAYVYIAASWESLALDSGNVFPVSGAVLGEDGLAKTGYAIFYYLADPTAANEAADYDAALAIALENGIGIAGVVLYPADGTPEDAGLSGYSYRELGEYDFGKLAVAWVEPSAYAGLDADVTALLDALVSSLRDTDDYVSVDLSEPAGSTFGNFHTTDLLGAEYDHNVFSQAKLTLVNVWATYCGPCLSEMPDLGALAKEYADRGFQIIGIPIDIFEDDGTVSESQLAKAIELTQSTGADYTHLIAEEEMFAGLLANVQYVPSSWFIDSDGNPVSDILIGGKSKEDWASSIEQYLALVE